ncbi:zinc ribbon domain-containing protein [Methanobrevibacter wolinii]|uniref:zinc ribbon domain-containing protein n=1 Tax=Methanobrevibacter wolinii TaxID=190977 RepID=UPI0005B29C5C|nr:zinc ribbon domain-containing protein [Methanobrevibacter wolinii]
MAKYCPKCGKEHIHNEEYCVDCHTKLPDEKLELNDKAVSIFNKDNKEQTKVQKKGNDLNKIFTYERKTHRENKKPVRKTNKESLIFRSHEKEVDVSTQKSDKKQKTSNTNNNNKQNKTNNKKEIKSKTAKSKQLAQTITKSRKRKIISVGIVILLILIIIFVGVSLNDIQNNNSNNVNASTQYNFTEFSINIPNSYKEVNDTNYMASFEGNNVKIDIYNTSLSSIGYAGASIDDIMSAVANHIGNNEDGTVQSSDYINVSGNSGYNITYTTENNTVTRYIGFIKGDNEYDIIVTTDTNNQNALDNVSNTLVNSIKIKG